MARKFLVAIDLNKNELQNAVLQNLSVAPENAVNGMAYYDTQANSFKFFENGAWTEYATYAEMTEALKGKVDLSVYTAKISEIETSIAGKADKATTLEGYGITDAYTKTEVDGKIDAKDSLPEQEGHEGEFLKTSGTAASWSALPIASETIAGIVKKGENINIAEDGTISAIIPADLVQSVNGETGAVVVSEILDSNTKTKMVKLWIGTKEQYDAIETKDENTLYYIQKDGEAIDIYELLNKKQNKLNAGTNIELVDQKDGTVTVNNTYSYTLPIASDSVLGGVKVGTNLSIDSDGKLSATGAVVSVNGETGVVVLDKASVGLDKVDNTSDLEKPISTATQTALDGKANKATTLAGYGIEDAYTKDEVDAKVSSVYKFKGSVANEAALPSEGNVEGDVYNVEDTGDNYAWVDAVDEKAGYWDKLSGNIDLSAYSTTEQIAETYLTKTDAESTYLAKTDAASTYATKEEVGQISSSSVHKLTYTNEALTPSGGIATWAISHSLGADVEVVIKEIATGNEVIADVVYADNLVTIKMNAASNILAGTYKVVILG